MPYLSYYAYMTDPQQLPPAGWCPNCGMEIYAPGEELCTRCRRPAGQGREDDDA